MSESLRIELSDDESLVLVGPPRKLTGPIDLHNPSDVTVVVRDLHLSDPSGALTGTLGRQSFFPLVVRAQQRHRTRLSVSLDPATPPGTYRAELELGGSSRPVVLHVSETIDLTVHPQSIQVLNQSGPQRRQIVVSNEGNVAFVIGDLGPIDLEDDLRSERAERLALEPWTQVKHKDIEGPVLALLRVEPENADRARTLSVCTADGAVRVAPGEVAAIDLVLSLAATLPHNGRYRGRAPLLTRDLEFIVVSAGEPTTPSIQAAASPHKDAAEKPKKGRGGRP